MCLWLQKDNPSGYGAGQAKRWRMRGALNRVLLVWLDAQCTSWPSLLSSAVNQVNFIVDIDFKNSPVDSFEMVILYCYASQNKKDDCPKISFTFPGQRPFLEGECCAMFENLWHKTHLSTEKKPDYL